MSISKSETDVILNKANVALARSQRLVASWLPAQTEEESLHSKSEEELQREEDEIFTAVPETLGVGAPLPSKAADGSWNRTELDSNDKLRKQLLGRNYKKVMAASAAAGGGVDGSAAGRYPAAKPTGLSNTTKTEEEDDDDDEGRTALVGKRKGSQASKKRKVESTAGKTVIEGQEPGESADAGDGDEEGPGKQQAQPKPGSKGRKKATSFLDEILAERSKKRKKR